MNTANFNRYQIKLSKSDYQCLAVNGEKISHFIAPDTKAGIKKLYVVKNGGEIYYVGITSQSISSRLRYGLKADGEHGYHGYKWKDKITQAELLIWSFPGSTQEHVEAIEAELVYFIRKKTDKWPKYQMEIHFHGASESERQIARAILDQCLK